MTRALLLLMQGGRLYPQVGGRGSSGGMSQGKKPHRYHGEHAQSPNRLPGFALNLSLEAKVTGRCVEHVTALS